jgi:hypothetical protein
MIRRQYQHQGVRVGCGEQACGYGNRRRGISGDTFEDDMARLNVDLA